ncbi:MAG TPA: PaaI family thioesterase [Actinomycetota bacterium]|nr:PaaI family thioesterase [Actinomycetota bacterium]
MTLAEEQVRSRTVTWGDPMVSALEAFRSDGLTFLTKMAAGEIPVAPIASVLGFDGFEVEDGRVTFTIPVHEFHYNPIGTVHGGVLATLADSAMTCAVQTTLPVGRGITTLDLSIRFLRPVTADTGRLVCVGEAIHVGRRIGTAEARITDPQGRLVAHATTTCMVLEGAAQ